MSEMERTALDFWHNRVQGGGCLMRSFTPAVAAALLLLSASAGLRSQDAGPAHAPDGHAQQFISPLYFSPKPGAPFTATAKTVWVRTLPDGSTVTTENARLVTRDAEGRVFQERVTFVPVPNDGTYQSWVHATDYTNPVEHTHYHCDTGPKVCDLFDFHGPVTDALMPAGLQPDKSTFLTREDLGVDTFAGLDVQKSRETFTIYRESVGNTKTILRTVDYWYSPALGVNVQVKRHDPREGDQTLWLTNVSLTASDPEKYKAPADYRVIDERAPAASVPAPTEDPR
jgi:hypothetical protein